MALARGAPPSRVRGGLRVPSQATRREGGFGCKRTPPGPRIRDLGLVHRPELVSARPQEHGAVQHSVADAAETRLVPHGPAHIIRAIAAEEDQAADRTTITSLRSPARARIAGKRRRDR